MGAVYARTNAPKSARLIWVAGTTYWGSDIGASLLASAFFAEAFPGTTASTNANANQNL